MGVAPEVLLPSGSDGAWPPTGEVAPGQEKAGHGHDKASAPPPQTDADEAVEGPGAKGVALGELSREDYAGRYPWAQPWAQPCAEPWTLPGAQPQLEPWALPWVFPWLALPWAEPWAEPWTEPYAEPCAAPYAEPWAAQWAAQ